MSKEVSGLEEVVTIKSCGEAIYGDLHGTCGSGESLQQCEKGKVWVGQVWD